MNLKKTIILILFASIIVSCNVAFASDFNENNTLSADLVEISSDNPIMGEIDDTPLEESSNFQTTSTNECTVFVGTNSTLDGKGTEEDPFATLELACNHVNNGEQKGRISQGDCSPFLSSEPSVSVSRHSAQAYSLSEA